MHKWWLKKKVSGTSLAVQLDSALALHGAQVQSQVVELGSHMLGSVAKKKKFGSVWVIKERL